MTVYLYNYEFLYPRDYEDRLILGNPLKVEPMTRDCHNVQRQNANGLEGKRGWEFQLVDDPKGVWYCTSYDWSLVLKTDANLAQYAQWKKAVARREEMKRIANTEYERILGPAQVLGKGEL